MIKRLLPVLPTVLLATACTGESPLSIEEEAASTTARYIVELRDFERGKSAVRGHGRIALEVADSKVIAAHLTASAAAELGRNPHVAEIELDEIRRPFAQEVPYGINSVQASDAIFDSGQARNRTVCVIDSGLYTGHEDFAGVPASGFNGNLAWNQDGCGHGTHVAGTIAAQDNNAGVIGVAPNQVSLYIVRVFGDDCVWAYSSDLVDALSRCRNAGAQVVSMSLGGSGRSKVEQRAFDNANAAGVLSIAAAGNDGTETGTADAPSYPAGYASVVSVAATDSANGLAAFSQENTDVELAAPGVGVLSTVPFVSENSLTVGNTTYRGSHMEGAAFGSATGTLVNGGRCTAAGSWSGRVVICERGDIAFVDKVNNVIAGGGVAAVVYNNVPGAFSGTLGEGVTVSIQSITIAQADGQAIVANNIGQSGTVNSTAPVQGNGYEAWDGTSMATPHVSAVAALVWSQNTSWTNTQIRNALNATALDLGGAGRDISFGNGLVQARRALDFLNAGGCSANEASACSDGIDNDCDGLRDSADFDCMTCRAAGASCTASSQCCSGTCRNNGRCR
jgi:serine protease